MSEHPGGYVVEEVGSPLGEHRGHEPPHRLGDTAAAPKLQSQQGPGSQIGFQQSPEQHQRAMVLSSDILNVPHMALDSQQQQLRSALVASTVSALPIQPDHISNVQGPYLHVKKVDAASVDVNIIHSFRAHFHDTRVLGGQQQQRHPTATVVEHHDEQEGEGQQQAQPQHSSDAPHALHTSTAGNPASEADAAAGACAQGQQSPLGAGGGGGGPAPIAASPFAGYCLEPFSGAGAATAARATSGAEQQQQQDPGTGSRGSVDTARQIQIMAADVDALCRIPSAVVGGGGAGRGPGLGQMQAHAPAEGMALPREILISPPGAGVPMALEARRQGREVNLLQNQVHHVGSPNGQQPQQALVVSPEEGALPLVALAAPSRNPSSASSGNGGEWEIDPAKLQLGRRIAVGGFAEVFLARYEGTLVAVKRLYSADSDTKSRFIHEIRLLARLRHPNLILFMGYCTQPELCIVSEFMSRGSLYHILRQQAQQHGRPLEPSLQRLVAVSVARGMAYLHSRCPPILHLDLKSPNILVDERWRVKISDFGLSTMRQTTFVSSGNAAGTPEWMAPEVLRCERYGEPADVYSFGVVLWELLTGHVPWEHLNPMQVVGAVGFASKSLPPPDQGDAFLVRLCTACLAPSPPDRPTFPQILALIDQHMQATRAAGHPAAGAVAERHAAVAGAPGQGAALKALPAPGDAGGSDQHNGVGGGSGEQQQRPQPQDNTAAVAASSSGAPSSTQQGQQLGAAGHVQDLAIATVGSTADRATARPPSAPTMIVQEPDSMEGLRIRAPQGCHVDLDMAGSMGSPQQPQHQFVVEVQVQYRNRSGSNAGSGTGDPPTIMECDSPHMCGSMDMDPDLSMDVDIDVAFESGSPASGSGCQGQHARTMSMAIPISAMLQHAHAARAALPPPSLDSLQNQQRQQEGDVDMVTDSPRQVDVDRSSDPRIRAGSIAHGHRRRGSTVDSLSQWQGEANPMLSSPPEARHGGQRGEDRPLAAQPTNSSSSSDQVAHATAFTPGMTLHDLRQQQQQQQQGVAAVAAAAAAPAGSDDVADPSLHDSSVHERQPSLEPVTLADLARDLHTTSAPALLQRRSGDATHFEMPFSDQLGEGECPPGCSTPPCPSAPTSPAHGWAEPGCLHGLGPVMPPGSTFSEPLRGTHAIRHRSGSGSRSGSESGGAHRLADADGQLLHPLPSVSTGGSAGGGNSRQAVSASGSEGGRRRDRSPTCATADSPRAGVAAKMIDGRRTSSPRTSLVAAKSRVRCSDSVLVVAARQAGGAAAAGAAAAAAACSAGLAAAAGIGRNHNHHHYRAHQHSGGGASVVAVAARGRGSGGGAPAATSAESSPAPNSAPPPAPASAMEPSPKQQPPQPASLPHDGATAIPPAAPAAVTPNPGPAPHSNRPASLPPMPGRPSSCRSFSQQSSPQSPGSAVAPERSGASFPGAGPGSMHAPAAAAATAVDLRIILESSLALLHQPRPWLPGIQEGVPVPGSSPRSDASDGGVGSPTEQAGPKRLCGGPDSDGLEGPSSTGQPGSEAQPGGPRAAGGKVGRRGGHRRAASDDMRALLPLLAGAIPALAPGGGLERQPLHGAHVRRGSLHRLALQQHLAQIHELPQIQPLLQDPRIRRRTATHYTRSQSELDLHSDMLAAASPAGEAAAVAPGPLVLSSGGRALSMPPQPPSASPEPGTDPAALERPGADGQALPIPEGSSPDGQALGPAGSTGSGPASLSGSEQELPGSLSLPWLVPIATMFNRSSTGLLQLAPDSARAESVGAGGGSGVFFVRGSTVESLGGESGSGEVGSLSSMAFGRRSTVDSLMGGLWDGSCPSVAMSLRGDGDYSPGVSRGSNLGGAGSGGLAPWELDVDDSFELSPTPSKLRLASAGTAGAAQGEAQMDGADPLDVGEASPTATRPGPLHPLLSWQSPSALLGSSRINSASAAASPAAGTSPQQQQQPPVPPLLPSQAPAAGAPQQPELLNHHHHPQVPSAAKPPSASSSAAAAMGSGGADAATHMPFASSGSLSAVDSLTPVGIQQHPGVAAAAGNRAALQPELQPNGGSIDLGLRPGSPAHLGTSAGSAHVMPTLPPIASAGGPLGYPAPIALAASRGVPSTGGSGIAAASGSGSGLPVFTRSPTDLSPLSPGSISRSGSGVPSPGSGPGSTAESPSPFTQLSAALAVQQPGEAPGASKGASPRGRPQPLAIPVQAVPYPPSAPAEEVDLSPRPRRAAGHGASLGDEADSFEGDEGPTAVLLLPAVSSATGEDPHLSHMMMVAAQGARRTPSASGGGASSPGTSPQHHHLSQQQGRAGVHSADGSSSNSVQQQQQQQQGNASHLRPPAGHQPSAPQEVPRAGRGPHALDMPGQQGPGSRGGAGHATAHAVRSSQAHSSGGAAMVVDQERGAGSSSGGSHSQSLPSSKGGSMDMVMFGRPSTGEERVQASAPSYGSPDVAEFNPVVLAQYLERIQRAASSQVQLGPSGTGVHGPSALGGGQGQGQGFAPGSAQSSHSYRTGRFKVTSFTLAGSCSDLESMASGAGVAPAGRASHSGVSGSSTPMVLEPAEAVAAAVSQGTGAPALGTGAAGIAAAGAEESDVGMDDAELAALMHMPSETKMYRKGRFFVSSTRVGSGSNPNSNPNSSPPPTPTPLSSGGFDALMLDTTVSQHNQQQGEGQGYSFGEVDGSSPRSLAASRAMSARSSPQLSALAGQMQAQAAPLPTLQQMRPSPGVPGAGVAGAAAASASTDPLLASGRRRSQTEAGALPTPEQIEAAAANMSTSVGGAPGASPGGIMHHRPGRSQRVTFSLPPSDAGAEPEGARPIASASALRGHRPSSAGAPYPVSCDLLVESPTGNKSSMRGGGGLVPGGGRSLSEQTGQGGPAVILPQCQRYAKGRFNVTETVATPLSVSPTSSSHPLPNQLHPQQPQQDISSMLAAALARRVSEEGSLGSGSGPTSTSHVPPGASWDANAAPCQPTATAATAAPLQRAPSRALTSVKSTGCLLTHAASHAADGIGPRPGSEAHVGRYEGSSSTHAPVIINNNGPFTHGSSTGHGYFIHASALHREPLALPAGAPVPASAPVSTGGAIPAATLPAAAATAEPLLLPTHSAPVPALPPGSAAALLPPQPHSAGGALPAAAVAAAPPSAPPASAAPVTKRIGRFTVREEVTPAPISNVNSLSRSPSMHRLALQPEQQQGQQQPAGLLTAAAAVAAASGWDQHGYASSGASSPAASHPGTPTIAPASPSLLPRPELQLGPSHVSALAGGIGERPPSLVGKPPLPHGVLRHSQSDRTRVPATLLTSFTHELPTATATSTASTSLFGAPSPTAAAPLSPQQQQQPSHPLPEGGARLATVLQLQLQGSVSGDHSDGSAIPSPAGSDKSKFKRVSSRGRFRVYEELDQDPDQDPVAAAASTAGTVGAAPAAGATANLSSSASGEVMHGSSRTPNPNVDVALSPTPWAGPTGAMAAATAAVAVASPPSPPRLHVTGAEDMALQEQLSGSLRIQDPGLQLDLIPHPPRSGSPWQPLPPSPTSTTTAMALDPVAQLIVPVSVPSATAATAAAAAATAADVTAVSGMAQVAAAPNVAGTATAPQPGASAEDTPPAAAGAAAAAAAAPGSASGSLRPLLSHAISIPGSMDVLEGDAMDMS